MSNTVDNYVKMAEFLKKNVVKFSCRSIARVTLAVRVRLFARVTLVVRVTLVARVTLFTTPEQNDLLDNLFNINMFKMS